MLSAFLREVLNGFDSFDSPPIGGLFFVIG